MSMLRRLTRGEGIGSATLAMLAALAAGCGSSQSAGAAGGGGDGGGSDGSESTDGAALGDGQNATDGSPTSDGSSTNDSGSATDAANHASPAPVDLGASGNFAILAMSGISTVPTSAITGDLGVSPAAATYITGFSLIADATNVFSTSPQVTGKVYASNYAAPTPANLTAAIGDMGLAFTDAAGRAPDVTELGAGNIGGLTLAAGVYEWSSGLLIPTDVTLHGSATDVWIFQVAQDLTMSSATHVLLSGGAVSRNVFWQVSGAVSLGTTSQFEGVILGMTSIALQTGASIDGRLLAQKAVSLEGSTVVQPAP